MKVQRAERKGSAAGPGATAATQRASERATRVEVPKVEKSRKTWLNKNHKGRDFGVDADGRVDPAAEATAARAKSPAEHGDDTITSEQRESSRSIEPKRRKMRMCSNVCERVRWRGQVGGRGRKNSTWRWQCMQNKRRWRPCRGVEVSRCRESTMVNRCESAAATIERL